MDAGSGDRLSGWKEIAQHLRRSVRSAQRWERELGLPVQRVKTAHGQVVYGSRSELDAWMARFAELPPDHHDSKDHEDAPAIEAGTAEPSPVTTVAPPPISAIVIRRRFYPWWYAGAAVLVVASFIAFSQMPIVRTDSQIDLALVGQALEARNAAGALVWSHQFGSDVIAGHPVMPRARRTTVSAADVDLDGDGRLEYIVPVRFGQDTEPFYDVLYAFDDGGKVVWSIQPSQVLSCRGETFRGPWRAYSVVVSTGPGPKRVWVALNHHTWWPSFVLEVSPDGLQTMRYVQAGWIFAMTEWTTTSGNVLALGGVINEWARASVVLVDLEGPATMLPAADAQYRCDVNGTVPPRQVTLFPPQEVARANGNAYVMVHRLTRQHQELRVEIDYAHSVAVLGPDGAVLSYEMSDDYWVRHDVLARAGKLNHMASDCPDRASPREIRTWTPQQLWNATFVGHPGSRLPGQR